MRSRSLVALVEEKGCGWRRKGKALIPWLSMVGCTGFSRHCGDESASRTFPRCDCTVPRRDGGKEGRLASSSSFDVQWWLRSIDASHA